MVGDAAFAPAPITDQGTRMCGCSCWRAGDSQMATIVRRMGVQTGMAQPHGMPMVKEYRQAGAMTITPSRTLITNQLYKVIYPPRGPHATSGDWTLSLLQHGSTGTRGTEDRREHLGWVDDLLALKPNRGASRG